ncbi:MAG: ROK family protein [Hyphomicrobiaceae bacterium]
MLYALHRDGLVSRHQIADSVGITRATVSKATQALINSGIVREVEQGVASTRGGRRPILLSVCEFALHLVGIDIRREKVTGCCIDLSGNVIEHLSVPLNDALNSEELTANVVDVIEKLSSGRSEPLGAIGIGAIGPVDVNRGRSYPPAFPALYDLPIVSELAERFRVPVTLRTGAVAAAYGEEQAAIAERNLKSIAFVVIDHRGIGLGLISGGAGWLTEHGGIGELGHVTVDFQGRPCKCGRRGCLTQYASGIAAMRIRDGEAAPDRLAERQLSKFVRAAEEGDHSAQDAMREAGRYLGCAIVDVDRLLRPSRIVVGSSHEHLSKWYLLGVEDYIRDVHESTDFGDLLDRVMPAHKGSLAIAYGAASLQLKHFMRAPARILTMLAEKGDSATPATGVRH